MKMIVPKMRNNILMTKTMPTVVSPSVPCQAKIPIKPAINPYGAATALIGNRTANSIVRFVSCSLLAVTVKEGTIVSSPTYLASGT